MFRIDLDKATKNGNSFHEIFIHKIINIRVYWNELILLLLTSIVVLLLLQAIWFISPFQSPCASQMFDFFSIQKYARAIISMREHRPVIFQIK